MKPIKGYQGYFIDQNGQVFSVRNSRNGSAKPLTIDKKNGRVRLLNNGRQYWVKISDLMEKVWGL